jgi:hypothetical protein
MGDVDRGLYPNNFWQLDFFLGWNPTFYSIQSKISGGGIFLMSTPQSGTRMTKFTPRLDEIWIQFPFNLAGWNVSGQAGYFRWRFNSESKNVGEFLTRKK